MNITPQRKLLITGFDPFGGESINPSWEAVRSLPDTVGTYSVTKLCIPTEFDRAAQCVLECAKELSPDVIICVGQAGGRVAVTPEMVGINLRFASIPDNAGLQPQDTPAAADGPAAYFTTLPVRRIAESVKAAGIPCAVSYSAGTFVCNDVMYTLLHTFRNTVVRTGFIHVPYLPEQVKNGEPSLSLEQITAALRIAIESLD